MIYRVTWGRGMGGATVTNATELDAVLETVGTTPNGDPYNVTIFAKDVLSETSVPPMIDICVGHPDRSYIYHVGADGSCAWGYESDLEPMSGLYVNYGGVVSESWPERARVSPTMVRQAAREFVTNQAQRPGCVSWTVEEAE
jgi:hypothetical protein